MRDQWGIHFIMKDMRRVKLGRLKQQERRMKLRDYIFKRINLIKRLI